MTTMFSYRASCLAAATVLLSVGCGGGGGESSPATSAPPQTQPQQPAASTTLVPLTRYTGAKGTFQSLSLVLPASGILDLSLQGTRARIFDANRNMLNDSSATPSNYQVQLAPGSYVVELEYWSANELHAMAYSPALLPVEQLPMLKNGAYSSTIQTTSYHRVSFAQETDLYFSGLGVNKTVYDTGMNLVKHLGESDQQVKLPAGQYVVKLHFWSSNTKSVNVTSPGLQ